MPGTLDEKKMIARLKKGDAQAFEHLFDRYKNKIFSLLLTMDVGKEDAQDLTQETFIKVIQHIDKHRIENSFSSWIYAIAVNSLKDFRRKRKEVFLEDYSLDLDVTSDALTEDIVIRNEEKRYLREMIQQIPPRYRIVLLLRFTNDLSYEEIARILNGSVNQISVDLYRAKKILKKLLSRTKEDLT
ncbi:sigma-70 family RNA polymerase sigma factor [Paenibacillus filicis]|uniref:RNA polymerase sigma factor n=1 Tax=Paenibacillus filicis TaxID=669464 RepID=A0ABU9DGK3_9BACL